MARGRFVRGDEIARVNESHREQLARIEALETTLAAIATCKARCIGPEVATEYCIRQARAALGWPADEDDG